jgi:AAA+ ATPase superfamily predicted ATPase
MNVRKYPELANPFPLIGYNGPRYFCDRETELAQLTTAIAHGRNVSLIARRRIGKSSLLQHFCEHLLQTQKGWKVIYLDLMRTSSLGDLYQQLAHAIYEVRKQGLFRKLSDLEVLGRLRMTLGVNPITQLPEVSFDLRESQIKRSFTEVLTWLGEEKKVLIILDEFQQILNYPQKETEGYLRAEAMRLPGIRFIYCGSDQHVLSAMFTSSLRPFFNSTQNLSLDSIPPATYKKFIETHLKTRNRKSSPEALDYILFLGGGETYAVQKICNALFERGYEVITVPLVQETLRQVLAEQQSHYERVRALLGGDSVQFTVLRILAREGGTEEPTGKHFLSRLRMTNASSVRKSILSLEKYGLISRSVAASGKLAYMVNDALFAAWLTTLPH